MNTYTDDAKPKKAIIYLRVSTEEQVDNFSLGTQEELCRKEALRRGFEIIEVFKEEGRSAKTILGRPVLIKLLEYSRKNKQSFSAVFVYRLDRISRQTADYLAIRKKLAECEISLLSATEPTGNSPTEKLIETMLAGFAQLDNDVRSERTKNGMRARFLSGLHTGVVPLGYINENGYVTKDPQTFDNMQKAWELMATGNKTLAEMARIMNQWGLRHTLKGKEYSLRRQTLQRFFRNKFYLGILTSTKYSEEVRGQHPPMVTEQQFYRVQAILDGRNTNIATPLAKKNKENTDFPLRRVMNCGKCGTVFTGAWTKGRNNRYAYYFCRDRCGAKSVAVEDVHKKLIKLLEEVTPTDECLKLFIALLRRTYIKRLSIIQKKKDEADAELTKLYALRQALIEKNLNGIYSDEIFREQNKLLEEKITILQVAKSDVLLKKYNLEDIIAFIKEYFENLGTTYINSNLTLQKILLGSIFTSKLHWSYPGISNHEISPLYQYIRQFDTEGVPFGDPNRIRTDDFQDENLTS